MQLSRNDKMDGARTGTSSVAEGLLKALKRRGIDHVLAMVGVGLFAVLTGGRAVWLVPASLLLFPAPKRGQPNHPWLYA